MFKVRATQRFSSMSEGHKSKGDRWETSRDRAYALMAMGVIEIEEGDPRSSNFETHSEPASSLPPDPLRSAPFEALKRGELGQPSRSTTAGVLTSTPTPSTPPMATGGASEISQPDSDTLTSSESSSEGASGPAIDPPPENSDSDSSTSNDVAASPAPKASSARAVKSGTAARKRST